MLCGGGGVPSKVTTPLIDAAVAGSICVTADTLDCGDRF